MIVDIEQIENKKKKKKKKHTRSRMSGRCCDRTIVLFRRFLGDFGRFSSSIKPFFIRSSSIISNAKCSRSE